MLMSYPRLLARIRRGDDVLAVIRLGTAGAASGVLKLKDLAVGIGCVIGIQEKGATIWGAASDSFDVSPEMSLISCDILGLTSGLDATST